MESAGHVLHLELGTGFIGCSFCENSLMCSFCALSLMK